MVARIKSVKSIQVVLYYNERKVAAGVAERIGAANFLKDPGRLSLKEIRYHLHRLDSLNERSVKRALHLSLNFAPSEKLSNEKMRLIAERYMDLIGYGAQPFVVYRHFDAAHPHIHIVSTSIGWDGRRIGGVFGRRRLNAVRQRIEASFGLLKAGGRQLCADERGAVARVVYGRSESRASIERVLRHVLQAYCFTNLEELNALLRLYNLSACPAADDAPAHRRGGVLYRVLHSDGTRTGKPLSASDLRFPADKKRLEEKFQEGRAHSRGLLKTKLDKALLRSRDARTYVSTLRAEGIEVVTGQQGSLFYVDHGGRQVVSAGALGAAYATEVLQVLLRAERQEEELAWGFRRPQKNRQVARHL